MMLCGFHINTEEAGKVTLELFGVKIDTNKFREKACNKFC